MLLCAKRHDEGIAEMERAVELDSNFADGLARLSEAHVFAGNPRIALEYIQRARRRVHLEYYGNGYWAGEAYFYLEQLEKAERELQASIAKHPGFFPARRFLAAVLAEMGRVDGARAQVEEVLKLNPHLSISLLRRQLPFRNAEDLERQLKALRIAGLPE